MSKVVDKLGGVWDPESKACQKVHQGLRGQLEVSQRFLELGYNMVLDCSEVLKHARPTMALTVEPLWLILRIPAPFRL